MCPQPHRTLLLGRHEPDDHHRGVRLAYERCGLRDAFRRAVVTGRAAVHARRVDAAQGAGETLQALASRTNAFEAFVLLIMAN